MQVILRLLCLFGSWDHLFEFCIESVIHDATYLRVSLSIARSHRTVTWDNNLC